MYFCTNIDTILTQKFQSRFNQTVSDYDLTHQMVCYSESVEELFRENVWKRPGIHIYIYIYTDTYICMYTYACTCERDENVCILSASATFSYLSFDAFMHILLKDNFDFFQPGPYFLIFFFVKVTDGNNFLKKG